MVPEGTGGSEDFSQDDIDNLFDELKDDDAPASKQEDAPAEPVGSGTVDELEGLLAEASSAEESVDLDDLLAEASAMGDDAAGGDDIDVSQDEISALLSQVGSLPADAPSGGDADDLLDLDSFQFEEVERHSNDEDVSSIDLLRDVSLNVKIELGRANLQVKEVLGLSKGSVVELDKLAGDPLDILVNNRLVAKGEVLVLNDNFCIRITEILTPRERIDQENT